jgi:DNA polymerase-1
MKKLFLVDAYALIFRAYYAFLRRPMTNSKGFETSAIFGFTKSLLEVLKKEKPSHIAIAFDLGVATFRHDMYPQYKANRQETPEAIKLSSPIIKDIVRAMNIPVLEKSGYEADDIIGTLAKKAESEGYKVYMVTPDKDFGQLVSDNIFMYKPKRIGEGNEILGVTEICEQYKIHNTNQVIDILALWGDASDNVPGVPGIGEKGASKLIHQYGSIENIYEHLNEIPAKTQKSLDENREQVALSKKLVTICTDTPIGWSEKSLEIEEPDKKKLREIFEELEFFSFIKEMKLNVLENTPTVEQTMPRIQQAQQGTLFGDQVLQQAGKVVKVGKTVADVEHSYHLVQSDEDIDNLVKLLSAQTEICFDTETSGLDPLESKAVGMSFAIKPHEAWYVPIPQAQAEAQELLEGFRLVFENDKIAKIGQNLKYDILVLKAFNIEVRGELLDTMLMHYVLDPESRHNMTYLSETYLGYSPIEIEELIGKKGAKQGSMANVDLKRICEYAAEDADVTIQLKEKLYEALVNNGMLELYQNIEAPLITVLADMETAGVRIDIAGLNELKKSFTAELLQIEDEVRKMADEPQLNISSPKQLGVALFEKLKIDENVKRTKTKQYSTSEETLMGLADKHPIINKILEYRSLKKLLSSYIESLPDLLSKRTGKIHTSFNQAVTATGRLSSNNPNLQNIPIRDAKGREIRKAFIASDDEHILLSADYSQIELRLMAYMSEDPNLIEAFRQNQDIHTATAAKVFHVPLDKVSKEQRSKAKTANFGIIYGISAFGLASRLNIPRSEAKDLIDGYFAGYPQVKTYIDKAIYEAQQKGYVSTIFGRKRWLRDINSGNAVVRGNAERNAINAPIQGSAADIIKIAMINIQKKLKNSKFKTKMILQVHDELVFDVLKAELDAVRDLVMAEMQNAVALKVPLLAECGIGENWLEAH